jgi:hypothetical protein
MSCDETCLLQRRRRFLGTGIAETHPVCAPAGSEYVPDVRFGAFEMGYMIRSASRVLFFAVAILAWNQLGSIAFAVPLSGGSSDRGSRMGQSTDGVWLWGMLNSWASETDNAFHRGVVHLNAIPDANDDLSGGGEPEKAPRKVLCPRNLSELLPSGCSNAASTRAPDQGSSSQATLSGRCNASRPPLICYLTATSQTLLPDPYLLALFRPPRAAW